MKKQNIYKLVMEYFRKQYEKSEREAESMGKSLDENQESTREIQAGYGENNDWSAANNDQMSMRTILEKKMKTLMNMQDMTRRLEQIYQTTTGFTSIDFGTIFSLQNSARKVEYFLLAEGDNTLEVDNMEIWICSKNSPMGKACLNKKADEKVIINKNEYTIKEIF